MTTPKKLFQQKTEKGKVQSLTNNAAFYMGSSCGKGSFRSIFARVGLAINNYQKGVCCPILFYLSSNE